MIGFKDDIENLYVKLFEFIKQYEILDNKDPFTPEILNEFKNAISQFKKSSDDTNDNYIKQIKKYEKAVVELVAKYNFDEAEAKKKLDEKLKEINEEYEKKIASSKAEIDNRKNETDRKCEGHELDIECYINASMQNVEMFLQEHDENIKRFDYQNENSKASYSASVATNNNALEKLLSELKVAYDDSLKSYDIETKGILDNYDEEIQSTNNVLNKRIADFAVIQNKHKEEKYTHSVSLNDKIRKLADETNQRIVAERQNYMDDQAANQAARDEKHRQSIEESQKISKDFVLSMTILDEKQNKLKKQYSDAFDNLKREYEYTVLAITKKQETELREIYTSGRNPKKCRKEIKAIQKNYHLIFRDENEKHNRVLHALEMNYLEETQKIIYEKKLLDIERAYKIKAITEVETRDNKYYQEKNNVDEADFNYQISVINHEYNKNANIIRHNAALQAVDLDTEFEKQTAIHQKNLEKQISRIKRIKVEINSTNAIYELIHNHEKEKYEMTVNHRLVHNLLEIEKCKVLATFNNEQYLLNKANADLVLNYSKENIDIQNEKYKTLKDVDVLIDRKIFEGDSNNTNHKNELLKEELNLNTEAAKLDNKFLLNQLSQNLLAERFNYEIKCVVQSATNFALLLTELENLLTTILDIMFGTIELDNDNIEMVRTFTKRITAMMFEYYSKLFSGIEKEQKDIIDGRLRFEEEFKFKSYYIDVNKIYDSETRLLNDEKRSLTDEQAELENKIDLLTRQSFTLQGQLAYIKDPKNAKGKTKAEIKSIIAKLNDKLKTNYSQIIEANIKIEEIKKKIGDLTGKIQIIEKAIELRKNEIRTNQYNNAIAYHNYKKNIEKLLDDISVSIKNKVFNDNEDLNYNEYESEINSKRYDTVVFDVRLKQTLYKTINDFNNESLRNVNKSNQMLLETYEKDISELKVAYNMACSEKNNKYNKLLQVFEAELNELHERRNNFEKNYDQKIKDHNEKFNADTQKNINDKEFAKEKFYNEYYAVCDNQKEIDDYYSNNIVNSDITFDETKKKIISDSIHKNDELKTSLESYIEKRDDLIKSLPDDIKIKKIESSAELKRRNHEIDSNKVQARVDYSVKHKELEKNLEAIDLQLEDSISGLELEKKNILIKEKKDHLNELKKIAR